MMSHPEFSKRYPKEVEAARQLGNRHDPDYNGCFPWVTMIRMTQSAFGRLGFHLHFMGGHFAQSFCMGGIPPSISRAQSYSVECLIWLPATKVKALEDRVGAKVRPAPIAHLNSEKGKKNDK